MQVFTENVLWYQKKGVISGGKVIVNKYGVYNVSQNKEYDASWAIYRFIDFGNHKSETI
jgi:hypothetical protein